MRHPSFKNLQEILVIEDPNMRLKLAEAWWAAWVVQKTATQSVLNRSLLSADQNNVVCEAVAEATARELVYEQCVTFNISNTKYDATITALRNRARKS